MLIVSPRHFREDLEAWANSERQDAKHAQLRASQCSVHRALSIIDNFYSIHRSGYVGVSWGKDSTIIAHMVARLKLPLPLVWIRVEPIKNPDCSLVRDEFLRQYPETRYEEFEEWCSRDSDGWHATGTLERGFKRAEKKYGAIHVSGIRAQESAGRKMRMMLYGESSPNTCAPIGKWTARDVFAYLYAENLPVHPAYACTFGGRANRDNLRVASLGGQRGSGFGRGEWEQRYYRSEMSALMGVA